MKTTDLFQSILLFALFLCGLTACNDSDEIRLSPFQETTVKGEASTLQIDLTRGDWRITSITTPWGDLMMDGNKLPQLEGTGSLHYKWWDLERDTDSHLILHFKDNFDLGESRSLIINLEMKTGLYKEQIIIHQVPIKMKIWETQPTSMTTIHSSINGQNTHSYPMGTLMKPSKA